MNATEPGVPLRPLLALTAAVALLHALALKGAPPPLAWGKAGALLPLHTRTIAPPQSTVAHSPDTPGEPAPQAPAAKRQAGAVNPAVTAAAGPPRSQRLPVAPAQAAPVAPSSAAAAPQEAAAMAPRLAWPEPGRWRYEARASLRGVALAGTAVLHWRPDGEAYEAVLTTDVPGLPARTQRSEGRIGPSGLEPLRYGERTRSELATHFDAARGRIVFSSNRPEAPWRPGAQDRVSVLLQLAAIAAGDPGKLAAGATVTLQTAGAREAQDWQFESEGEQTLDLPIGTLRVVKLARAPQREYDLRMEGWFVPGRAYGPVRLRLTLPNGDWLDLLASGADKG